MNFDCSVSFGLLIAIFVLGFFTGVAVKSQRLKRIERKIERLEILTGQRKDYSS